MRAGAASLRAKNPETVRVVDYQPGIETFGQCQQLGQWREVAVHAEHGVGKDQLALGGAGGESRFERGEVVVWVAHAVRPRQLHGVDQRGVVELVGEDRVVASDKRRDDGQVGHVTGR